MCQQPLSDQLGIAAVAPSESYLANGDRGSEGMNNSLDASE